MSKALNRTRANLTIEYLVISIFIISISLSGAKIINRIFKENIAKLEEKLNFDDWDFIQEDNNND